MTRVFVYPHKDFSKGAKALTQALGHVRYKRNTLYEKIYEGSFADKPLTIINWGNAAFPTGMASRIQKIINRPDAVNLCGNKVKFFDAQKAAGENSARIPVYTEDPEEAIRWATEGIVVMGRQKRGSCGTDIVFYEEDPDDFLKSDFWVQYKKKKDEFRVHIVGGRVIDAQRKAVRTTDAAGEAIPSGTIDYRIRNLRNGFVFAREGVILPPDVVAQAELAMANVGLDFGAVDVIWNAYEGKAYVLEINTAPGLEGQTVDNYAASIRTLL